MKKILVICIALVTLCVADASAKKKKEKMTLVLIETNYGDIKVGLYNETPKHKENFLKLVNEGFYEGVLFHRIIKDFMIQAGDPNSKDSTYTGQLGSGDVGYKVPAEIVFPQRFHKKGALAAARQADMVNPEKESSGCQFYIVQGKTFTEQEIDLFEQNINKNLSADEQVKYTQEQRMFYKMFGGTPHLDGQYTVFGEVIEGYEVIEKIANAKTGRGDRPVEDVRIISARTVRR